MQPHPLEVGASITLPSRALAALDSRGPEIMDGTLESLTRDFFAALDRKDFDHLVAISADDVQVVDEISGGWLRGQRDIDAYLRQLGGEVSNIASSPRDIHTAEIDS